MDWMLYDALYSMAHVTPSDMCPHDDCGPAGTDLWITRLTYEFVARETACDVCGAGFRRRLSLAVHRDFRNPCSTAWQIGVQARCRGWRRHRYSALVTETTGGLRFGELRPCRS